jgi:AmmeMemoRadiSam system protein B
MTFSGTAATTLFVATANAASYIRGRDPDRETAAFETLVTARDWKGLVTSAGRRLVSACGVAGVAALLSLAGEAGSARILARGSSRASDEDPSRVVSYAAVGLDDGRSTTG